MQAWLEIDLRKIDNNIKALKSFLSPETKILAVVKSNAYGHGLVEVSKVLAQNSVSWFGVRDIAEALKLRKAGIDKDILVMSPPEHELIEDAIKNNITLTLSNIDDAKQVFKTAKEMQKRARGFAKIDTGMRRFGPIEIQAVDFIKKIKALPKIDMIGIYSHLSDADSRDKSYTFKQLGTFQEILEKLKEEKIEYGIASIANSAAALSIPSSQSGMVRLGIVLYGLFPTPELGTFFDLEPALSFKAKLVEVKKLGGSQKISYSGTYTTKGPTTVGIIPVGYADGIRRSLSNLGKVLVGGMRCPIIGRVTMNSCIIDVSEVENVRQGDEAVIIGRQGMENITAGEIAGYVGTINYEVVSSIPEHVPRKYIRGNIKEAE